MAAPLIPLFSGTVPNRNQAAAIFSANADDWLAYQEPLAADYNALGTFLNDLAIQVEGDAADAAAGANFKGLWVNLTGALNVPASVEHNSVNWQLLNDLADVTLSEPGVTSDWSEINPMEVVELTGGGDLSASKVNQLQDGGTYDLPLAANYPSGKFIDVDKRDLDKTNTPIVRRKSTDLIAFSGGTDTSITLNQITQESLRFTSNGVDRWSI